MKEFSLPKCQKVKSNNRFKAILDRNLRFSNELVILYMAENNCDYPRLAVSVGKKIAGAVERNRLKRLVREVFRQQKPDLLTGFDYLVMFSPKLSRKGDSDRVKLTFDRLRKALLALFSDAAVKIRK